MTVDAIKEAIARLPDSERHDLVAWLNQLDADEWDREMAADFSPGGRGAVLIEKVKRELGQGQSAPLEEGLRAAQVERRRPDR